MNERQVFGLILRTAGLGVILHVLTNPWLVLGWPNVVVGLPLLGLGLYLLRGAPRIVRFSYRPEDPGAGPR